MNKTSTHGGPGRGQGRKPLAQDEPTVRVTVRLSQSQYDWLLRQGNVSEVLRKLIDLHIRKPPLAG